MKRTFLVLFLLVLIFGSIGCSVELNQTPVPEPSNANDTSGTGDVTPLKSQVPVTWGHLGLRGKLIYIYLKVVDTLPYSGIQVLDLTSGEITTIFQVPSSAVLYDLAVSPDGSTLLLSYAPPVENGSPSSGGIYRMPIDGSSAPQKLFEPAQAGDQYFQVEWAPDGKTIYYTGFNYNTPPVENGISPVYILYRRAYPEGPQEQIAMNSMWLTVSPDSSRIAYVKTVNLQLQNEIFIANADGSNATQLPLTGPWIPDIKDAPVFLPNGSSILFSAPVPQQSYQPNWIDKLMGVRIAKAHNVPSDWWSVPVQGGEITRLTQIQTAGLFASVSPDQKYIASLGADGIFVMSLDGSNLTQLVSNADARSVVRWIP